MIEAPIPGYVPGVAFTGLEPNYMCMRYGFVNCINLLTFKE